MQIGVPVDMGPSQTKEPDFMNHLRAKVLGVLVAALAIGVFAIVPAIGSADQSDLGAGPLAEQGCPANNVCGYQLPGFEGQRREIPCSQAGIVEPDIFIRSARNRCGNKLNRLSNSGGTICMNPGGDRPNPGTFADIILPVNFGEFC
jgi:hypothetical protein